MKKIILLFVFLLNFILYFNDGKLEIHSLSVIKAWGDEGSSWEDNWWDPDYWGDGGSMWIDENGYTHIDYDGDGFTDELIAPDYVVTTDTSEDTGTWIDDNDDPTYNDPGYCPDEGNGGGDNPDDKEKPSTKLDKVPLAKLQKLLKEWNEKLKPGQTLFVDIDEDGIMDGILFKDSKGDIHFKDFSLNEVIVKPDGKVDAVNQSTDISTYVPEGVNDENAGTATDEKKTPTIRDDCEGKSEKKSAALQKILNDSTLRQALSVLRLSLKEAIELGFSISYDPSVGYYVTKGQISVGASENVSLYITSYVAYTAHSHGSGLIPSPSCGDAIQTGNFYMDILNGNIKDQHGYKGTIVIGNDGSEYGIVVDDAEALKQFYKKNPTFFERDESSFKDAKWKDEFNGIKERLEKDGFSESDAQSYALSYMLDKYNTGLKIHKRENKEDKFKEQKTKGVLNEKEEITKYEPQICP